MGPAGAPRRFLTPGSIPLIRATLFRLALCLGACSLVPARAQAQSRDTIIYGSNAPGWAGQMTSLSVNTLFGGLAAGVFQELRGGSFKDGFARGALGGAVTYAGKRISGRRFSGAGLAGRELAALGSSMVRNAGEGRGLFQQLAFPVGPVWLHVTPETRRLSASVDVIGAAWLAWGIAEPELNFQAGESLSAGAPVFRTNGKLIVFGPNKLHGGGFTAAGNMLLSDVPAWGSVVLDRVAAHERVHVPQQDQLYLTLLEPGGKWLLSRVPYVKNIARHVDLNLSTELMGHASRLFDRHSSRPWEAEAIFFSR